MKKALIVKDLCKSFKSKEVLSKITFDLKEGEITCLVGPSGSGKTTLLRCLSLLEDFERGEIIFNNNIRVHATSLKKTRRRAQQKIGLVFQDFNLWPHKTVLDNIIEPLILVNEICHKEARQRATSLLNEVGLESKHLVYPDFLSGGQKQRVAIARTLAMGPEILLLDEITSSLDPELISGIVSIIRKLARKGQTMLIITHQMELVNEIADNVLFMDEGKVVAKGTVKEMKVSENKKVRDFFNPSKR